MLAIPTLVLLATIGANCQLLRDEERPTRYVLPYAGLASDEDLAKDEYYKPTRRAERIPAAAYQYDEEEEYYKPPQRPQKPETESSQYRSNSGSSRSHKEYEQLLRNNHLTRLRVAAKKQPSQQQPEVEQPQQPVEQYLKEVNPTTKTSPARQSSYGRYRDQDLKQTQSQDTARKEQQYKYVLQPEQKSALFQYETQGEALRGVQQPRQSHFNLVAFQNALNVRQKLLAAENQEEAPSKSSVYVSQNVQKKTKKQKTTTRGSTRQKQPEPQQFDYYESQPQTEAPPARYQAPARALYTKPEVIYPLDDVSLEPEQKEVEYQIPSRAPKPKPTRAPKRKPKYQEETVEEEQVAVSKYQPVEEAYNYQYQDSFRRPAPRPVKQPKYEESVELKDDYLYQPVATKYQRERKPQYQPEPEPRGRFSSRQTQYQDEVKQYVPRQGQYQEEPKQYAPRPQVQFPEEPKQYSQRQYREESKQYAPYGDVDTASRQEQSVSYRQELPNSNVRYYRNLGEPSSYYETFSKPSYTRDLIQDRRGFYGEQEEESNLYYVRSTTKPSKLHKIPASSPYKYYTHYDTVNTKFVPRRHTSLKYGIPKVTQHKETYNKEKYYREEDDLDIEPSLKSTAIANPSSNDNKFLILVYDD